MPGCPVPGDGRGGPAARPEHHRREPANPLRPIASRAGVPRRRDRTAHRQRVPAAGRPGGPARPGRVRQVARASSASRRSTPGSSTSCTRCSPHRSRNRLGASRLSRRSRRPAGKLSNCPAANSSTSRSRTGPGGCCRSPAPSGYRPAARCLTTHTVHRHPVHSRSHEQVGNERVVIPRNGLRPQRLVRPGEVRRVPGRPQSVETDLA